jgi:CheY-like chemotaxis protein
MKGVKILLLDDSEVMLRHISSLLIRCGATVHSTLTMPEAIEAFLRYKPTVVLADFVLEGGRTGLETIEAIFALCPPETKPRAAILTLGKLSDQDKQRAAVLKIALMQKPARGQEEDFTQTIEIWLDAAKLLG